MTPQPSCFRGVLEHVFDFLSMFAREAAVVCLELGPRSLRLAELAERVCVRFHVRATVRKDEIVGAAKTVVQPFHDVRLPFTAIDHAMNALQTGPAITINDRNDLPITLGA